MKKYLVLLMTAFLLSSCVSEVSKRDNSGPSDRIKYKEHCGSIRIIEIDGIEYVVASHGGIYPLVQKSE